MYKVEDMFMIRQASHKISKLIALIKSDDEVELLDHIINNPDLRKCLAVASKEFDSFLNRLENGKDVITKKSVRSAIGYLSRIYLRATPFGLYSGVGVGFFSEQLKSNQTNKHVLQSDAQWTYKLIRRIEQEKEILLQLRVIWNPNCYVLGERYYNPISSAFGLNNEVNRRTSIKLTKSLNTIIEMCKSPTILGCIHDALCAIYTDIPDAVIIRYLADLVYHEYLITELRCPILDKEPLSQITEILKKLDLSDDNKLLLYKLNNVQSSLNAFDINSTIDVYYNLRDKMEDIIPSQNVVNAMSSLIPDYKPLELRIKSALEHFACAIEKISRYDKNDYLLKDLRDKFVEKYGYNVEINILELLDPDVGLGNPYLNKSKGPRVSSSLEKWISNIVTLSIISGKKEVIITDSDIESLCGCVENNNNTLLGHSFELCARIIFNKKSDSLDDDFSILVEDNIGSRKAGNHFNRFYRVLSDRANMYLDTLYENVIKSSTNCEYSDVRELHSRDRLSNVCCGKTHWQHTIYNGCYPSDRNRRLSLSDIYIGCDHSTNKLYIKASGIDDILIVDADNMLNEQMNSAAVRLMRDISNAYVRTPISVISRLRIESVYTPEIKYRNIIIKPETWKISRLVLDAACESEFIEKFKLFANNYKIPELIILHKADQTVLLSTKNKLCLHYLFHEYKRTGLLHLTKYIDCGCDYSTEYVFMFCSDQKFEASIIPYKPKTVNWFKRTLYPGERNWIYLKLYIGDDNIPYLLSEIKNLIFELYDIGYIDKSYYLKYSDINYNLRLRLHAKEKEIVPHLYDHTMKWFQCLKKRIPLNKVTLDSYEPEIERYGGVKVIEYAESVFSFDTNYCMNVISLNLSEEEKQLYGIFNVFHILESFGLNLNDSLMFLNHYISKNDFKKEYRAIKNNIRSFFETSTEKINKKLLPHLEARKKSVEEYKLMLQECNKAWLQNINYSNILMSLVHMSCNRHLEDKLWERKIIALTRHYIQDQVSRAKFAPTGDRNT